MRSLSSSTETPLSSYISLMKREDLARDISPSQDHSLETLSSMALTTPTKGPMALVLRAVMCKKEKNIIHCLLENVELNDVCSNIRYISFLNT